MQGLITSLNIPVRQLKGSGNSLSKAVAVYSLVFSRDTQNCVLATADGCLHDGRLAGEGAFVRSLTGHLGGVYAVHESPFMLGLYLTASEDWTVKLWGMKQVIAATQKTQHANENKA